jgi:hypothetical protein
VRDVKRLVKVTGIDDQRLGLILEVAAAAGLIAAGVPEPDPLDGSGSYWAPTVSADRFIESPAANRWFLLASTWLDLTSRPALIGGRGPDSKPYAALSDSLFSTAAPLDRQLLLSVLADLAPGLGVDADGASRALVWRRPRWAARLQPSPVAALLTEAHALGVVGRGAIAAPIRKLLAGDSEADVVAAMAKALPKPIAHFLLQADLTVVVPGPLERELAEQLSALATVESAGAAMVYRISEQSIRRALDTGRTAAGIHAFFARHSKTPVPQGLTYLIDDVARRHGQLRVGMAASFVRCEDRPCWLRPSLHPRWMRLRCASWPRPSRCLRPRSPRCSPRCAVPVSCRRPRTRRARSSTSAPAAPGSPCPPGAAVTGQRPPLPPKRWAPSSP